MAAKKKAAQKKGHRNTATGPASCNWKGGRVAMTISINPELRDQVRACHPAGRISDIVDEALRDWLRKRQRRGK